MSDQNDPQLVAANSLAATQSAFGGGFVVPADVKAKFPELIELITASESMNDEERQYWVNILPIMTPDQLQNLKDILVNERQQLAAIDAKYEQQIKQVGQEEFLKQVDHERKTRMQERAAAENQAREHEDSHAEDLLKKIEEA